MKCIIALLISSILSCCDDADFNKCPEYTLYCNGKCIPLKTDRKLRIMCNIN